MEASSGRNDCGGIGRTCGWRERRGLLPLWGVLWLFLLCFGWSGSGPLSAQNADQLAYDAALRDFELGQWDRAARTLAEFVAKHPDSPLKLEASQRERFARAEAAFARGQFAEAAEAFAAYGKDFTTQPRGALAAIREASARLRLGDRGGAIRVLESPTGAFAAQVQSGTEPGIVFSGLLLKAEALRGEKRLADAEAVLNLATSSARQPVEQWTRMQALVAVQEEAGQLEAAAATAEALWKELSEGGSSERKAEAAAMAGRLWTRAGKSDLAQAMFARNAAAEVPLSLQQEAVLQLADAAVARGDYAGGRERLQAFLTAHPGLPDAVVFHLRLGQALLRQYLAAGGATNSTPENNALLGLAAAEFDAGLAQTATAEVSGMLHLGRGWTGWHEGVAVSAGSVDRIRLAASQFAEAAALLPPGASQATARFKLADAQLRLQEPAAALTNYLAVAQGYPQDAQVQAELVERALQQAVLAAVEARDTGSAGHVVELLLARQPAASAAGDSTLQVARALTRSGNASGARAVLERFLNGYPGSPVVPDAQLELIKLDLRAGSWTNAMTRLDRWIGTHTNHPSLVRAEFDRAWAAAQAGASTNAVEQFASLAIRYPTNAIAQTALFWVADHYASIGDYARAEAACVSVLTNAVWQGTEGWYLAHLRAAEAAHRRQSLSSARDYLVALLDDRSTPTNLFPSALFALGDIRLEEPPVAGKPALFHFQQALEAFTAAAQFTNSPVAVAAQGKMGDCYLQLASQSTNNYAKAEELYRGVQESALADVSARSKAAFGRGVVAEKLAGARGDSGAGSMLTEALNRYLEILNGSLLLPGETADPWWFKEAGREAGRLLEGEGRWADAATLYERLARELPTQQTAWQGRAAEARRHLTDGTAAASSPGAAVPPTR